MAAAALLDWLALPISGAPEHAIAPWAAWHARLMTLGWGLLLPLGALGARYFKVMPGQQWPRQLDNPAWWHAHRALQWSGVLAMTVGLWLVLGHAHGATPLARAHGWAGWTVAAVGWLQIAAGLARGSKGGPTSPSLRGDHYDMSAHRQWFERLHKSLGWLSVIGAIGVIAAGLVVADAPRWMPVALVAWWSLLAAAAWRWQRQKRCVDTYQAIWGPDPVHPGNRMRPIGWGVHRPPIPESGPGADTAPRS